MTDERPRRVTDHDRYDELAVGWALHALEPEDESAFAVHLAGCDRCTATVAETSEVMAAMATDLPVVEPSEGLRERLRAAVEETEQVHRSDAPVADAPAAPRPAVPSAPRTAGGTARPADTRPGFLGPRRRHGARSTDRAAWRRVVPNALVAAGVAAILALGAWNVVVTQDRDAARATASVQSQVMDSLLSPGQATIAPMEHDGRTVATVVARDGQAQVVIDGMTVNDTADSTYVLWGMTDGAPVPLGTFDVVTEGVDLRTVGSDATGLDDYSAYGISIEAGRQAPSAPTDIVANGQVSS
ncbi:anti-sigma factor [Modestobacter sp. Leaf380]|uniref:anti-sigma factor n=1 Tax=Modestobacter sp. Leaf380 TaxID=1736356 RepID=UPI0006F5275C|nr:anti-sigma factor [Modestobacter sp. Leaf380]KQS64915.1 anti-sigma factor [Modestobacter sp. Leaf380]